MIKRIAIAIGIVIVIASSVWMVEKSWKTLKEIPTSVIGKVVRVDATAGKIIVNVDGEDEALTAEPKVLKAIKVGEKVEIEKTGEKINSIKEIY